ncbi:hypothetical protein GCM10022247_07520 [Allokutzneria multivorans]|uniref:Immunity protein Imm1 n=1 Tax=Allokutzneria multivorans TaxID=1142134 RepID=A0ABP7R3L3_9PSEU
MTVLHVWYSIDKRDQGMLAGTEAIDAFLDRLAEGKRPVLAALFRAEDLDNFPPRIEMLVGLGGAPDVGIVHCDGVSSSGSPQDSGEEAVYYDFLDGRRDFPASAVIPLAQVRAAVHEFAATGERPKAVM